MPSILTQEVFANFTPDRRGDVGSKFIAVPEFIIVDAFSHEGLLNHWKSMVEQEPALLKAALEQIQEKDLGICGVHREAEEFAMFDAGYLSVKRSVGHPDEVVVSERSRDYGCAMSLNGRPETVHIAQTVLGQEVHVTMAQHY